MKSSYLFIGAFITIILVAANPAACQGGSDVCRCESLVCGSDEYQVNTGQVYPKDGDGCYEIKDDSNNLIGKICWTINWDDEEEAESLDWTITGGTFTGYVCVKGGTGSLNNYNYEDFEKPN